MVEENTNLKQQFKEMKEEMDALKLRVQVDEDANHSLTDNITMIKGDVSENNVMINQNLLKIDSIEQKFGGMHENLKGRKQKGKVFNFLD